MKHPNHRGYYRVEYPVRERPDFEVGERTLRVIDCSESGLRYALPAGEEPPQPGTEIRGIVRLKSDELEVRGVVVRIDEDSVAVRFTGDEIPFRTIIAEQKYLRRHYLAHLTEREGSG